MSKPIQNGQPLQRRLSESYRMKEENLCIFHLRCTSKHMQVNRICCGDAELEGHLPTFPQR